MRRGVGGADTQCDQKARGAQHTQSPWAPNTTEDLLHATAPLLSPILRARMMIASYRGGS